MSWAEFAKNHAWPILGGLALVLLQVLYEVMGPGGFTVSLRQLGFSLLYAAVGYGLTVLSRYGGPREGYAQPAVPANETVFPAQK